MPDKKPKEFPVRDMRCEEHKKLGCLECWSRIILDRTPPGRQLEYNGRTYGTTTPGAE